MGRFGTVGITDVSCMGFCLAGDVKSDETVG